MSDERFHPGQFSGKQPRAGRTPGDENLGERTPGESIREEKRRLREEMTHRLEHVDEADARHAGAQLLERVKMWLKVDEGADKAHAERTRIFAFASFGREPDTWQLLRWLWSRNRAAWLPRVVGRQMRFYAVRGEDELAPTGYRGVAEPESTNDADLPRPGDLIIVPGLAFTTEGARLGRGGGYYDRFLARRPADAQAIGIGYRVQLVDSLPFASHDAFIDEFWPLDSAPPDSCS